jgi:hypothetical protein
MDFPVTVQVLRRAVFGPVLATGALTVLAVVVALPPVVHQGWVLPWLLLGLAAGYSLSGSA